MAQKVETHLIDDLDGGPAHETVQFSIESATYDIDLSNEHAAELRDALAKYVAAARRTKPGTVTALPKQRRAGSGASVDRAQSQAMRQWARAQGWSVADRGRIPEKVADAWHARAAG